MLNQVVVHVEACFSVCMQSDIVYNHKGNYNLRLTDSVYLINNKQLAV
jgi:hypothetical protein